MSRTLSIALVLLLAASAAWSQAVRIARMPDGSRVIHNRGSVPLQPTPRRTRPAAGNDVREVVETHAKRQRLDPKLVDAVIRVESAYDPAARSSKGAMGLMQLMPATARELDVDDPWDPAQNIAGGTAYLGDLVRRYPGNLELALAAYNAGPAAVAAYRGIPPYPETRNYVRKVMAAYQGKPSYRLRTTSAARVVAKRTYLYRSPSGQLVLSTTPPAGR